MPNNYNKSSYIKSSTSSYQTSPSQHLQLESQEIAEKRLLRRVDQRVPPLCLLVYLIQFLDKAIIGYANIMGLEKDLGMKGNEFSWCGTAFFLGYLVAQLPQGALLQRFPPTKVLAVNIFIWSLLVGSTAAVRNPRELLALRTLLGVFEAAVTPSLILITSSWYQRREGVVRFGFWFGGLGLGQLMGALISFAAQYSQKGWRLMFVVVGLANIVISVFVYCTPSSPQDASWLTAAEKRLLIQRLKDDHAGAGPRVLRKRSITEVLLDPQTLLLSCITFMTCMSAGVVVYFAASIIHSFGYDARQAALLNMPSGLVSIITTAGATYFAMRRNSRCYAIMLVCAVATLGACLLAFLSSNSKGGLLLGIYLLSAAPTALSLVSSIAACNLRGYTRKVVGGAMIALSFSGANLLSPQSFIAQEKPKYWTAKIVLVAHMAAPILVAAGLQWLYKVRNARADECNEPAMSKYERSSVKDSNASIDFADRGFRYSY